MKRKNIQWLLLLAILTFILTVLTSFTPSSTRADASVKAEVEVQSDGTNLLFVTNNESGEQKLVYTTVNLIPPDLVQLSPDEQYIAFAEFNGDEVTHASTIMLIDLSDNMVTELVVSEENGRFYNPLWSPDSTKLAYVRSIPSQGAVELWIVDLSSNQNLDTGDTFWPTLVLGKTNSIIWEQDSQTIQYRDDRDGKLYHITLNNQLAELNSINTVQQPTMPTYSGMVKPVPVRDYDHTCYDGYTALYPNYGGCVLPATILHPAVDIADSDPGGQTGVIGCGTPVVAACDGTIEIGTWFKVRLICFTVCVILGDLYGRPRL